MYLIIQRILCENISFLCEVMMHLSDFILQLTINLVIIRH